LKKTLGLLVLVALLLVPGACRDREHARGSATTETIAPPAPQPGPTGTDAMTQTVDIEDSRSEDDGGTLVSPQTATTTTTAVTKTTRKKTKK